MVISLIGYRACGKSSVAPRLAGRLGWSWVDCDRAIEQRAGVTVRQIFESSGEAEFRRLESEVLAELLRGSETVIATGGELFCCRRTVNVCVQPDLWYGCMLLLRRSRNGSVASMRLPAVPV